MKRILTKALFSVAGLLASCDRNEPPAPDPPAPSAVEPQSAAPFEPENTQPPGLVRGSSDEENWGDEAPIVVADADDVLRRRLAALGYSDTVAEERNTLPDGLVLRTEESFRGFDLWTAIPLCRTVLYDPDGQPVHTWENPRSSRWNRARLLPDGDLVVVGAGKEDGHHALYVERWSWQGERRFRADIGAHHDCRVLPDGRMLTLTKTNRVVRTYAESRRFRDNAIALLDRHGERLEEVSLFDVLTAKSAAISLVGPEEVADLSGDVLDPLHANTVFWVDLAPVADTDPLYAPGNVLVCFRHQSLLAIVDLQQKRLVWSWGPGVLELPHDAQVLANGNLLVFDNGSPERGFSRILEVDPRKKEITWEYRAPQPEDFYSPSRGTVQPLPGGTVLIGDSDNGEAFEVTRDGREVWRFRNPMRDAQGARTVIRLQRYSPEYVTAAIAAADSR